MHVPISTSPDVPRVALQVAIQYFCHQKSAMMGAIDSLFCLCVSTVHQVLALRVHNQGTSNGAELHPTGGFFLIVQPQARHRDSDSGLHGVLFHGQQQPESVACVCLHVCVLKLDYFSSWLAASSLHCFHGNTSQTLVRTLNTQCKQSVAEHFPI